MAGVTHLVERWIVIPCPPSNSSDLAAKTMQKNANKALECRQNADKFKGETWKSGSPIQPGKIFLSTRTMG
tara:strand:+ start:433 stop:645 length:213 start_codon:yes stop_codon:yes gene_type:complete